MPAIEIDALEKSYGDVKALSGVDLTVPEGSQRDHFSDCLVQMGLGKRHSLIS